MFSFNYFGSSSVTKIKVNIKANGLSEVMGLVAGGAGVAILPEDMKKISQPGVTFIKMSKVVLDWKWKDISSLGKLSPVLNMES